MNKNIVVASVALLLDEEKTDTNYLDKALDGTQKN